MEIILAPESLRSRLGEDGLKDLVELINNSLKKAKEEAVEIADRKQEARKVDLEKLILETRNELRELVLETQKKVIETRADLIKWAFLFWVGQLGAVYTLLKLVR